MNMVNEKVGSYLIGAIFIAVIAIFFLVAPVGQDLGYHNFSDGNGFSYLPNTLNVLSNIPFFLVGLTGLVAMNRGGKQSLKLIDNNRLPYFFLFAGAVLVGVGSSYYHLIPNNETLVWDRIPMTIAFMGLYSVIISEFISVRLGKLAIIPLIVIGICSVLYWWFTEIDGVGDLRFYAVIQFFPVLTIPIILIFFRSKFDYVRGYWVLIATYVGAKIFETLDHQIHNLLIIISGHSIKHVLPAIGLYYLVASYKKRTAI